MWTTAVAYHQALAQKCCRRDGFVGRSSIIASIFAAALTTPGCLAISACTRFAQRSAGKDSASALRPSSPPIKAVQTEKGHQLLMVVGKAAEGVHVEQRSAVAWMENSVGRQRGSTVARTRMSSVVMPRREGSPLSRPPPSSLLIYSGRIPPTIAQKETRRLNLTTNTVR